MSSNPASGGPSRAAATTHTGRAARANPLRVGIAGHGAIGSRVAAALDRGIEGLVLEAVSAGDRERLSRQVTTLRHPPAVTDARELARRCDVIVECAPARAFADIARPAVHQGRYLVVASAGALLEHERLIARARETGARIIVATGALLGFDAVRAAAEGNVRSVEIDTRKPPAGLRGAPWLERQGIDVDRIEAPIELFAGSAREAAIAFPANVNVAAALSLAGIGPDRTRVRLFADPGLVRNTHTIRVDADSARFSMSIENVPTPDNPRTGHITPLSVIATLRSLTAPMRAGT